MEGRSKGSVRSRRIAGEPDYQNPGSWLRAGSREQRRKGKTTRKGAGEEAAAG